MTETWVSCQEKLEPVRDAFARNFYTCADIGASAAVLIDGEAVVDLWGGHVDATFTRPQQHRDVVSLSERGRRGSDERLPPAAPRSGGRAHRRQDQHGRRLQQRAGVQRGAGDREVPAHRVRGSGQRDRAGRHLRRDRLGERPPAAFSLMVYDPKSALTRAGLEDAFAEGVAISGSVQLASRWFERSGRHSLTAVWSSQDGIDLRDLPDFNLPAGSADTLSKKRDRYYVSYAFEQTLWRSPANPRKAMGLFGQASFSDGNPNPVAWSALGGLSGTSPIPGRSADTFGLAAFYYGVSGDLTGSLRGILRGREFGGGALLQRRGHAVAPGHRRPPGHLASSSGARYRRDPRPARTAQALRTESVLQPRDGVSHSR